MLNKGVFKQWVAALRSGDFTQTTKQLGVVAEDGSTSYCCLGVLCELAAAEGLVIKSSEDDCRVLSYDSATVLPPRPVSHFLGDPDFDYQVMVSGTLREGDEDYDVSIELTDLNDNRHWSFEQIADAIEATYLADDLVSAE